jgi:TPP-dependent trihydroxycyclohexane-1,2-dione (THcHDO) dehydratase
MVDRADTDAKARRRGAPRAMASTIGPGAKPMLRAEAIASLRRDTVKARCRGLAAMANSLEDQS